MSGIFLSDGIKDAEDQRAKEATEIAKKKRDGFAKIRAIDPMTNTMKTVWVKKDEATLRSEAEDRKSDKLRQRENDIARRSQQLETLKKQKELDAAEEELLAAEKELMKEIEAEQAKEIDDEEKLAKGKK